MAANPRHYWTAEEFLAFEAASKFKHELVNGEVYDMTGGTGDHSRISASAIISIGRQLDNSSCTVNTSDMMLKVSNDRYLYPDMSVVCGQPFYEDDRRLVLLNPTLVVEVTSQTTATYDRGLKREFYQQIPSVQAYLIIDQHRIFAEIYTRKESGWLIQTFTEIDDIIPLEMLNCELPMSQVYRGINMTETEAD